MGKVQSYSNILQCVKKHENLNNYISKNEITMPIFHEKTRKVENFIPSQNEIRLVVIQHFLTLLVGEIVMNNNQDR